MDTVTATKECERATALPDHLSWSALGTYATCPRRYSFRYIEHAQDERRASSLVFGGAIHGAIERAHESRMVSDDMPGAEALLAAFDVAWQDAVRQPTPIQFAANETAASLRVLAGKMLSAYRGHALGNRATVVGIEHAVRFRATPGAPPLEARIDLIEMSGRDLVLTDYKTSRSAWNEAKVKEHLPQLVGYSIAALPLLIELGARRVVPRFVVITKGKTAKVQVVEPKATQDDVSRFKQCVAETWKAIEAGVFVRREGWHCKGCPFRDKCGQSAGQR